MDGAIERAEVRGLADVTTGTPLEVDSIFYVGSIAKQFVAACVAMLEHDGELDLGDPVSRFVPGLPDWGDRVTIRHLVHHTGGVKERTRGRPGVPVDGVPAWGNAELLDALRAVRELDFEPGSRYGYSNRGYLLLAEVVAAASGTSLAAFAAERIFGPLGMTDTTFRDAPTALPERAARGHFEADDGARPRRAGALPRGRRRRAVDHRGRPRDLEREPRRGPAHGRVALGSPRDPRRPRRRDADPLRVGAVGAHPPRAADREPRRQLPGLGGEDGAVPDRGPDRHRAREP